MNYVSRSIHWLIPEEASPCDIFLYFRGKYVAGIAHTSPISFEFLEKIQKAKYLFIYIKSDDATLWDRWIASRYAAFAGPIDEQKREQQDRSSLKRAEFLSYIQKTIQLKNQNDPILLKAWTSSLESIQTAIKHPLLHWYFQQFHEPPDLFHHSARVMASISLFSSLNDIFDPREVEDILTAALIHELQGDPTDAQNMVASSATLETIEKHKRTAPKQVLELIQKQDELCSGKGFPNNLKAISLPMSVKIFSLFNHYDHYRLRQSGTRRARHEAVKALMEKRKNDFDETLWPLFWQFIEQQVELLS